MAANNLNISKEIAALQQEIEKAHKKIFQLNEIICQSNENFDIYKRHHEFFFDVYYSFYDELINTINRLHDPSRGCLSVTTILERNIKIYPHDLLSEQERGMLEKIENHPTRKKLRTIRDKLFKAHLDAEVMLNSEKQKKLYESNKTDLDEIYAYLNILIRAVEIISERDIYCVVVKSEVPIRAKREINELFSDLTYSHKKFIAAGVIEKDGKFLIAQRSPHAKCHPGLWEFPGGKVEDGETLEECLKRELFEELDITNIEIGEYLCTSTFSHNQKLYDMCVFKVTAFAGEIKLNDHSAIAWVTAAELSNYCYPEPDLPVIKILQG